MPCLCLRYGPLSVASAAAACRRSPNCVRCCDGIAADTKRRSRYLSASLSASPTVGSSAGKPCGVHLSSGRQGDNGWVVCMWKRGSDEKSLRRTLSACHSRSHDIVSRLQHAAEHSHHSATPVHGASLALPYHSRRRPGVAPRAIKEHDYRGAGGGDAVSSSVVDRSSVLIVFLLRAEPHRRKMW